MNKIVIDSPEKKAKSAMFHLTDQLPHLLSAYGYWAILFLIAIESTGIPVPGESMLIFAAVYAGTTHRLHIALVILVAAIAAVLGDNLGFLLGRRGGSALLARYGNYIRLNNDRLRLGRYLFECHGGKVVFFGRFVPVMRMWAAFLAGAHHMSWRRFLLFNAAGGSAWAALMGMGAYTLGGAAVALGGPLGLLLGTAGASVMLAVTLILRHSERDLQTRADRAFPCPLPLAA